MNQPMTVWGLMVWSALVLTILGTFGGGLAAGLEHVLLDAAEEGTRCVDTGKMKTDPKWAVLSERCAGYERNSLREVQDDLSLFEDVSSIANRLKKCADLPLYALLATLSPVFLSFLLSATQRESTPLFNAPLQTTKQHCIYYAPLTFSLSAGIGFTDLNNKGYHGGLCFLFVAVGFVPLLFRWFPKAPATGPRVGLSLVAFPLMAAYLGLLVFRSTAQIQSVGFGIAFVHQYVTAAFPTGPTPGHPMTPLLFFILPVLAAVYLGTAPYGPAGAAFPLIASSISLLCAALATVALNWGRDAGYYLSLLLAASASSWAAYSVQDTWCLQAYLLGAVGQLVGTVLLKKLPLAEPLFTAAMLVCSGAIGNGMARRGGVEYAVSLTVLGYMAAMPLEVCWRVGRKNSYELVKSANGLLTCLCLGMVVYTQAVPYEFHTNTPLRRVLIGAFFAPAYHALCDSFTRCSVVAHSFLSVCIPVAVATAIGFIAGPVTLASFVVANGLVSHATGCNAQHAVFVASAAAVLAPAVMKICAHGGHCF